jgi:hypothetical protein
MRKRLVRAVKRCAVLGVLAAYLAAAIGFPAPMARRGKEATPFPCQDHACGCLTAYQCWTSCCCTTAGERIAWARINGVEIPEYARFTDADLHEADAMCDHAVEPKSHACCGDKCGHGESAEAEKDEAPPCCKPMQSAADVRFVIGALARKCRGHENDWLSLAAALPPPSILAWSPPTGVVEFLSPIDISRPDRNLPPPIPPPRIPL